MSDFETEIVQTLTLKPPRRCAAFPVPLEDGFMAQLVIPLDLSANEASRLQELIATLVVPWRMQGEQR